MLVNALFLGDSLFIGTEKAFVRKWIVHRYGNASVNVLVTVWQVLTAMWGIRKLLERSLLFVFWFIAL